MSDAPLVQIRRALVEGVAVVDLLPREITEPAQAARMGEALVAAFELGAANPLLINMAATHYLSSTAFGVLMKFGRDVRDVGGRVAICAMDPSVRLGANILQLGQLVPIFDDEPTAIAALIV